jgi:hypothetical protein
MALSLCCTEWNRLCLLQHYRGPDRLIPFCADLSDASKRPTTASARRYLIDFGHPIENGDGNSSTPLAEVMREWFRSEGYKTREYTGLELLSIFGMI